MIPGLEKPKEKCVQCGATELQYGGSFTFFVVGGRVKSKMYCSTKCGCVAKNHPPAWGKGVGRCLCGEVERQAATAHFPDSKSDPLPIGWPGYVDGDMFVICDVDSRRRVPLTELAAVHITTKGEKNE